MGSNAALVLFGTLIICFIVQVPIVFSLLISSLATLALTTSIPLEVAAQRLFTATDSFAFMAIPFFILAGNLMSSGGISKRLINFANTLFGHYAGGLGIVSVVACMFFAAISGSGAATTAAIGGIMIPAMVEKKYDLGFSAALNASAGGIGVIIPPSIPFVTYAVLTGASVSKLFLAGIMPGILMGISLIVALKIISGKRGYKESVVYTWNDRWVAFKDAILALIMPVIVLGGIYSGKFTATESSVVAVVYGLVVGVFVYKDLNKENLVQIFRDSAVSTASILILIATASLFGWILTSNRIPDVIAQGFLTLSSNKYVLLFLINILLFILGTFMDTVAALIIVVPILFPIAQSIGVDPIHFGMIVCTNLSVGQITPPFGVNLFVASGVAKVKMEVIIKELLPFFLALVIAVFMVTYIPQISLFLVNMFM